MLPYKLQENYEKFCILIAYSILHIKKKKI